MLNIQPPGYKFCPFCATELSTRIEEEKERKYCPNCKWTYYPKVSASAMAVIVKEGKTVLVQRNREPYKGTWMFPAGFVDYGEHPEEAAFREAKEEVGLEATSAKFVTIYQVVDDPREPGHFSFVYRVEVKDGELKNNDHEENTAIEWFDIENPPEIGWQGHKEVMKKLQNGEI